MIKPIKIGIWGIGRAGYGMHVKELSCRADKFRFVACCDLLEDRLEKFSEEFGATPYTDYEKFLSDPEIELVDIATLSRDHYEHARAALLCGKNVFLEKPFVINEDEGRRLMSLANKPDGPRLFVRHNRRFEYNFETVNRIIDSGILGDVFEIVLRRNGYQRRNDWQALVSYGGGQTNNWGPHIIDHALAFCGGDYTDIFSDIRRIAWVGDSDDHVRIVLKGVNGRVVDMEISGGAAIPLPEYTVYGSKGALISDTEGLRLRYLDPDAPLPDVKVDASPWALDLEKPFANPELLPWKEEIIPYNETGDGADRIWDALYDTIRLGKPFPITPEQSLKVMEIVDRVKRGTEFYKA